MQEGPQREDGWGEVRGVVREGEGTGIRQRKAYLSGRSLLDPRPSALGKGGKDRVSGFSREDGKTGAVEGLGSSNSSSSVWRPISLMPPGTRKTEKGYGLGRAVGSTERESRHSNGGPRISLALGPEGGDLGW